MKDLDLFRGWRDASIDWILDNAAPQTHIADSAVIEEGEEPKALFVVSHGLYGASVTQGGGRRQDLGRLSAGSVYGEMAWLGGTLASASVRAIETSESLVLPLSLLEAKLAQDPLFAAEFMGSMARLLADRLRGSNTALLLQGDAASGAQSASGASELQAAMSKFKELVAKFDREARTAKPAPHLLAGELRDALNFLAAELEKAVRALEKINPAAAQALGGRAQLEFLPYLLSTETAARVYTKPRGYAGDFMTIEHIYDRKVGGTTAFGVLLDEFIMEYPPAAAVRNRRALLKHHLLDTVRRGKTGDTKIMSLACGPARELFDALEELEPHQWPETTLLDIDAEALALVRRRLGDNAQDVRFRFVQANLVRLALGRERIDLPAQHLIYSIGLIDYFNDEFVVRLLNWIHGLLVPGGRVILGNFHPDNPIKAFMDYIFEWRLIHRSEEDMERLFAATPFGGCKEVVFEEAGVNLFAIGERA